MSISSNKNIEVMMIKEIISNSSEDIKTKEKLLDVLNNIIKVADRVIEINDDFLIHRDSDYSDYSDDSD